MRLWVPEAVPPGLIERAVASAWPGASTSTEPAPQAQAGQRGVRVACELVLSGPGWFSLESNVKPDPLALILGQLSGLSGEQHALVQVLARPASAHEQRRLRTAARRLRAGIPPQRLARLIDFFASAGPRKPPANDPTISPEVREVLAKSSSQLYRCLIRITVTASSKQEAAGRIHAVLGAFAPYNGSHVWLRRRRTRRAGTKLSSRMLGRGAFLLGVPELAALAHLPSPLGIPGLARATARRVPPPPALPTAGRPLGIADAGTARPLAVSVVDARQHIHVLGTLQWRTLPTGYEHQTSGPGSCGGSMSTVGS